MKNNGPPMNLQTDRGGEFFNRGFQELMKVNTAYFIISKHVFQKR